MKISNIIQSVLRRLILLFFRFYNSFPHIVQCNSCGWQGRHLVSDSWHKWVICPKCRSDIRQRLFLAILNTLPQFSNQRLFENALVLHFAPESYLRQHIEPYSKRYVTTDISCHNCDLCLDMTNMGSVTNNTFDTIIAFDVLEHVSDLDKALSELYRIIKPDGTILLMVPQKDHLAKTFEDPSITSPEKRKKLFGQWNHLRIFGDDFPDLLEIAGFTCEAIKESDIAADIVSRNVLFPPALSSHPLATNYRKVFVARPSTRTKTQHNHPIIHKKGPVVGSK